MNLFNRRDLLDISPTLTEAAGAIVDVSFPFSLFSISLSFSFMAKGGLSFSGLIGCSLFILEVNSLRAESSFDLVRWRRIRSLGVSNQTHRSRGIGIFICSLCGAVEWLFGI